MNFDGTSILHEELVSNNLITGLSTQVLIADEFILLNVSFESLYPDEVMKKIKQKFENLDILEDAFERKKKIMIANLITDFDNAEAVNSQMQYSLVRHKRIINDIKPFLEEFSFKKLKKINNRIKKNNYTTYIMDTNKTR